MAHWDHGDIRRSMPEYRVREGDVVYNAPYRATHADLNAFVLPADARALQKVLDAELNACVKCSALRGSQQGLHFTCVDPWLVFIYAAFRSLSSADEVDKSRGFLSAFELSIWLPVMKRQEVAGTVTLEPAWFLPLVYTSPTASVLTGREVYGYPKVPAFLEVPPEGGPPVAVQLRDELGQQPDDKGRAPARLFRVDGMSQWLPGWNLDLAAHPLLSSVLTRYFENAPLIFRKQAGFVEDRERPGAQPTFRANYTALIESRVPITRLSGLNALDPSHFKQKRLGGVEPTVAEKLGILGARPEFGVAVRGCTLDIQHGREIWVAEEKCDYIQPLSAPGNDLIQSAASYNLIDRERPKEKRKATALHGYAPASRNTVDGVGEAYFGRTRPHAIQSLLSRHFPLGIPGEAPVEDAERDFVLFLFFRADRDARVQLYEFGVWVPVLHEKRRAWYVPYMFRAPGAAVIHAREWFGHPCQEGYLEFNDASPLRAVKMRRPLAKGRGMLEWERRDGIVFSDAKAAGEDYVGSPKDLAADGETQRVVGLLQSRHVANTTRACLQQIVTSERALTAEIGPEPLFRKASLSAHLRLGRLLDLRNNTQVVRGYRLNEMTVDSTPSIY